SNAEISFEDTRRGGIESSEDVQDHASRHIDVVEENPLPNMTPIRARRAHDELSTVTVDEQVVTEATLQRVKRKRIADERSETTEDKGEQRKLRQSHDYPKPLTSYTIDNFL
ncbi:hypothetical protein COOONC_19101, partial [Cooperia oncophora]